MNKIVIILIFISSNLFANKCFLKRAALDIGSGATKLKIAQVDICKNKIISLLVDKSFAVEYKSDLKRSKNNTFSYRVIKKGEDSFRLIEKILKQHSIEKAIAVATSAFRTSKNSSVLVDIAKKYFIDIKIITQKAEALLGYKAARLLSGSNNYIVWDIGGGSMQMVYKLNANELIYQGHLASVPFREYIIKTVQKSSKSSPNPISKDDTQTSLEYAKSYAIKDIPEAFKSLFDYKRANVIGIGGVHSKAILKAMGRTKFYTRTQLKAFLSKQRLLSDEELSNKYASTSVSNLILVLGYMQALNIDKVITGNINLSDGLLLN